jgi:O-antigen ligase
MAFNSLFFAAFAALLFINIKDIDKSRSALWKTSWVLIKERPLFGHGLGQSDKILHGAYSKNSNIGAPVLILNHSHNQYLTYLIELGFAGALLLLISLLYFLKKSKQFKNNILITYLFALGLLLFTESALQTSKPLYVFCFLFLVLSKNYPRTKSFENSH